MPIYNRLTLCLLGVVLAVLVWSGIAPKDRMTWWLEVTPALLGLAVLVAIRRRFRITPLLQTLIALHMILLAVGGHYTYAEVPLGNWIRDAFHLDRNHYDRLGHWAQGLVPALVTREIIIRRRIVASHGWTAFFAFCAAMTVSAIYELIEWVTAIVYGANADAFLGGQGDMWDTQEDMACALVGAVCALMLFSRWHNHQLQAAAGQAPRERAP
ncbi:MAG: putative rane protein [Chthoniobacter sp.]|jgi:putative membrane protein|nr:putative rane protein [Chthoniobacter sp.]